MFPVVIKLTTGETDQEKYLRWKKGRELSKRYLSIEDAN